MLSALRKPCVPQQLYVTLPLRATTAIRRRAWYMANPQVPQVHDFNVIDGRPVQFDLWSYASPSSPQPAFIYFHGGGLTAGNRKNACPDFLKEEAKNRGWSFISADYRLLIPATGKDILEDVEKLFEYIKLKLPQVDASRVAVGGGSAGGYVARLAALYAKPRPKALYSLYGIGGDFFSQLHMNPPPWCDADSLAKIAHMTHPTPQQAAQLKQEWDVPIGASNQTPHNALRTTFALWTGMVTEGTLLDFICGIPGLGDKIRTSKKASTAAESSFTELTISTTTRAGGEDALVDLRIIPDDAKKLIPQLLLDSNFPPTHLSHGLEDASVHPSESVRTYDQLKALGVDTELELVEGFGHMYEFRNESYPVVRKVIDKLVLFLIKHLEA